MSDSLGLASDTGESLTSGTLRAGELIGDALLVVLELRAVLLDIGGKVLLVHGLSASGPRMEQVDKEHELQAEVERNEGEDDAGELINNAENTITHPIRQPLLVVLGALRLEGEETLKSRIANANEGRNVNIADAEHDEGNTGVKSVRGERLSVHASGLLNLLDDIVHFCKFILIITTKVNYDELSQVMIWQKMS